MLILGQPGAGKTTMLVELGQKFVERAEKDLNEPIPILLSLASWQNDRQSIKDWIVAELNSGKSYKVRPDITKRWLENGEIIPLLDGLDELAAKRQESCVQKLNEFLQPGNWSHPLVVCSRIQEYQNYSSKLKLNTSVEIQPFTPEQIQDYLRRTGNLELMDSIRDDSTLSELAQTPFLLNIIVLSYKKLSLDKWQELKSSKSRLDYLFSTYIEEMLERPYKGKRPSREEAKRWLGWLAIKLIEQNETEFFIEKMQPAWLKNTKHQRIYALINMLLFSVLFSVLFFEPFLGVIFGLVCGLSSWLIGEIRTFEILHFNWKILQKVLIFQMILYLIYGLIAGLNVKLVIGLFGGLVIGLFSGLKSSEIETRTSPNQGIWRSLQNAVIVMLIVGLSFGLSFGLSSGLIYGLSSGLPYGLSSGGNACIQHFALRLILYCNGYIPWNYARFLDYATDRLFLQRVGGGYRFMHDLLRQHFATH